MNPAPLLFVASLAAWGAVAPVPESASPAPAPEPPADEAAPPAAGAPPEAAASVQPLAPPAIIAKGPLDVRARPIIVAAPAPALREQRPLYKQWLFWVIAGGLLATAIVVTVVATRPGAKPYTGNAPPYSITFQ